MIRLIEENNKNTPAEYNRIFNARKEQGIDKFDMRRWKKLLKYYRGGNLVDVGCLDSLVPLLAHERYPKAELWGVDVAEEAIIAMRRRMPYVNYQVRDAYETRFPDEYFDYAVAGEVIEHLENPKQFITELARIVKPGGVLAISTPLNEAIDPGAVDHERHIWSFDEQDIKDLLSPFGSVTLATLRSQKFPIYKYHFPNIIGWCKKQ